MQTTFTPIQTIAIQFKTIQTTFTPIQTNLIQSNSIQVNPIQPATDNHAHFNSNNFG